MAKPKKQKKEKDFQEMIRDYWQSIEEGSQENGKSPKKRENRIFSNPLFRP